MSKRGPTFNVMLKALENKEPGYGVRIAKEAVDWASRGYSTKKMLTSRVSADFTTRTPAIEDPESPDLCPPQTHEDDMNLVEARPSRRGAVICLSFTPFHSNTMRGFCDLRLVKVKTVLVDCTVHQKGTSRWVSPPAKPQLDRGRLVTDSFGKVSYKPCVTFDDDATRRAFSHAACLAVQDFSPDAFEPDLLEEDYNEES